MRLKNLTFATWSRSHPQKATQERWLRELYPWPVFAQVDCDLDKVGHIQRISHDGVSYEVTLESVRWQPQRGTSRYRIFVESEGLGWHARSFADRFDMCATPSGEFVTLFHAKTVEPLERVARAFFGRRWSDIPADLFQSLAVSRFLAACLVGDIVEGAFPNLALSHYPGARLVGGGAPMFATGSNVWIGYRFFSEHAYAWARESAGRASRVIAVYFADTKHQFKKVSPAGTEVHSIAELDANSLGQRHEDLIRVLLRGLELPEPALSLEHLDRVVRGTTAVHPTAITEADVNEALAALKGPCTSKADLRYQLAAAVVLNAWIESERRAGWVKRRKFYAFKQRVAGLLRWLVEEDLPGVQLWVESRGSADGPMVFVRIDGVDFSFSAVPGAAYLRPLDSRSFTWSGVPLKPIAPFVLSWARGLRNSVHSAQ